MILQKYPNFIFEKGDLKKEYLKKRISLLNDEIIWDVFSLETAIVYAKSSVESHSYEFFKNQIDLKFLRTNLKAGFVMNVKIKTKSNTQFHKTKCNWDSINNKKWTSNNTEKMGEYVYAIVPNYKKMLIPMSKIQKYLVELLKEKEMLIENLVQCFYEMIDQSSTNEDLIKEQIINNVTYLMENRVLEIVYEEI